MATQCEAGDVPPRQYNTRYQTRLAQARGVTHSDDEEMYPPCHSNLPVTELLSILKRPTTAPSSASTDATDDFLSKSAVMLGLHRTTTGSLAGGPLTIFLILF